MSTITPKQVQVVQTARRKLHLDEDEFREILSAAGGVSPDADGHISTKRLTQRGFERVMANLEHRGFRMRPGQPGGYWRERDFKRELFADPRQVQLMRQLAEQAKIGLPAFCLRMTRGRMDKPEQVRPREASNIIEALKQIIARESARQGPPPAPGKEAPGTDADRPRTATFTTYGAPSPTGQGVGQEWISQRDPSADWFD